MLISNKTEWSSLVPGTDVLRLEVVLLTDDLRRAVAIEDKQEVEKLFVRLAGLQVLSVGQLSSVLGVSRQRVYIKLLQLGIPYAPQSRRRNGWINLDYWNNMVMVVRLMEQNPSLLRSEHVELLEYAGSPGIVQHLTGVNVRTGVIE